MQGSQVVFIASCFVFTWTCFIKWASYNISNYSCIQLIVCHSFFTCQSVEYTVMNWHLTCAVMSVTSGMSYRFNDMTGLEMLAVTSVYFLLNLLSVVSFSELTEII